MIVLDICTFVSFLNVWDLMVSVCLRSCVRVYFYCYHDYLLLHLCKIILTIFMLQ